MKSTPECFFDRVQQTGALTRLIFMAITSWSALAVFVPDTQAIRLYENVNLMAVSILVVCAFSMLDLVINDLLPERYHFPFGLRMRHRVLYFCAFFYAFGFYMGASVDVPWTTKGMQLTMAIGIGLHALLDIRRREKPMDCAE